MAANPLPEPALRQRALTLADLDAVMAIETAAYAHPWTRGNFTDSLASGYLAELRLNGDGALLGYFIAMPGVDELHLLNITVAPAQQRRGHGRAMLDRLCALCCRRAAPTLWLEVRLSNAGARALYRSYGFAEVGLRRGYYPSAPGTPREDAVVMRLTVPAAGSGDAHELV